jgi:hypothetical protein
LPNVCCAAIAAGCGRTATSRSHTHNSHPSTDALASPKAGFGYARDIDGMLPLGCILKDCCPGSRTDDSDPLRTLAWPRLLAAKRTLNDEATVEELKRLVFVRLRAGADSSDLTLSVEDDAPRGHATQSSTSRKSTACASISANGVHPERKWADGLRTGCHGQDDPRPRPGGRTLCGGTPHLVRELLYLGAINSPKFRYIKLIFFFFQAPQRIGYQFFTESR